MEIKIVNVEPQTDSRGSAVARFDIIAPWCGEQYLFPGFTYFVKGDQSWVSGSSKKYEKDGEIRYQNWGGFQNESVHRRFLQQVRTVFKKYLEKNPSMEPEPVLKDGADEEIPF